MFALVAFVAGTMVAVVAVAAVGRELVDPTSALRRLRWMRRHSDDLDRRQAVTVEQALRLARQRLALWCVIGACAGLAMAWSLSAAQR